MKDLEKENLLHKRSVKVFSDSLKNINSLCSTMRNINLFISNQDEINEEYLDRLQKIEDKLLYIMDNLEVIEYRINALHRKYDDNVSSSDR